MHAAWQKLKRGLPHYLTVFRQANGQSNRPTTLRDRSVGIPVENGAGPFSAFASRALDRHVRPRVVARDAADRAAAARVTPVRGVSRRRHRRMRRVVDAGRRGHPPSVRPVARERARGAVGDRPGTRTRPDRDLAPQLPRLAAGVADAVVDGGVRLVALAGARAHRQRDRAARGARRVVNVFPDARHSAGDGT